MLTDDKQPADAAAAAGTVLNAGVTTLPVVQTHTDEAAFREGIRKDEAARVTGITNLCKIAGKTDKIVGFVGGTKTLAQVAEDLQLEAAQQDEATNTRSQLPEGSFSDGNVIVSACEKLAAQSATLQKGEKK